MNREADLGDSLAAQVAAAFEAQTPLAINAGGTKAFLGEASAGEPLSIAAHRGIVSYEPGELMLTARAGTPLAEVEALLAESDQMLAFEPPHYGDKATLGGTIAAGVSGPARAYAGAARDFVLGVRIINGRGETLRFGGQVMKNVAGYDLSRTMAGAFGTLGVLLDISLKVLPRPRARATRVFEHDPAQALEKFCAWSQKPWPITAAYWEDGHTYVRLAGAYASVESAESALGGEPLANDTAFWQEVRELRRPALAGDQPLWRLALPPAAPELALEGIRAIDWGGAQRWLVSDAEPNTVRSAAALQGGHASVYRGDHRPRFHPLPDALAALHRRLKRSMDPEQILNRGRLYPGL